MDLSSKLNSAQHSNNKKQAVIDITNATVSNIY